MAKTKVGDSVGSAWRWLKSYRFEAVVTGLFLLVMLAVAMSVIVIKQRDVLAKSLAEQKSVVSQPAPVAPEPVLAKQAAIADQPEVKPAEVVVSKPVPVAEIVTTVREVGAGSEIAQGWNDKNAGKVTFPFVEDLGWKDIHRIDGKPLYFAVWCGNKGTSDVSGQLFSFESGYCGATITTDPTVTVVTSWNDSAVLPSDQHYDMWPAVYVVNTSMDPEETLGRLLSERLFLQGKPVGFKVGMNGDFSKLKLADAQEAVKNNPPLFPDQLPQLPAGEQKPIIMTVHRIGSDFQVMADLNNPNAEFVTMPVEVKSDYLGVRKVDGKLEYVFCTSSDSGIFRSGNVDKKIDTGFVACIVTHESLSIGVATGWNGENERHNVSGDLYIVPEDEDIDAIAKKYAAELNKKENKPYVFAILSDGTVFEVK